MTTSGFTFIHNGVHGGYPFVEAIQAVRPFVDEMVVVDMASTDETRHVLEKLQVSIIDGDWQPGAAGECLKNAHALHRHCKGDIVWHFEADEVHESNLAFAVHGAIFHGGASNVLVYRLQVEQNFQRCRWYPELVHRVFPNDGTVVKDGHTTNIHNEHRDDDSWAHIIPRGFLWDVTNCFRDDWLNRVRQQQELWGNAESTHTLYVPLHANHFNHMPFDVVPAFLEQPHWTWNHTLFNLPTELKILVGETSYRETLKCRQLIS
jgi:hypothetical protein